MKQTHKTLASLLAIAGVVPTDSAHADITFEAETPPVVQVVVTSNGQTFMSDLMPADVATARVDNQETVVYELRFTWDDPITVGGSVWHEGELISFFGSFPGLHFILQGPLALQPGSATLEIDWEWQDQFAPCLIAINGGVAPVLHSFDQETSVSVLSVADGQFNLSFSQADAGCCRTDSAGTGLTVCAQLNVQGPGVLSFVAPDSCPWDCADGDGQVGIVDFLVLLADWGTTSACDFDGGGVGLTDFLALLAAWGPCP